MDRQQTTIHLPALLHAQLREAAGNRNISMSEMARRALATYLEPGPEELLPLARDLERNDIEAWPAVLRYVENDTIATYHLVDALARLESDASERSAALVAWLCAGKPQDPVVSSEAATVIASFALLHPVETCRVTVARIAGNLDAGRAVWQPRVAHLLDRMAEPPLAEINALLPDWEPEREAVGLRYLVHLARRARTPADRRYLLDSAERSMHRDLKMLNNEGLELAAALRAHELIDVILQLGGEEVSTHRALIALGSIVSDHEADDAADLLFDSDSVASYLPLSIDRPLPIPSWGIWPVPAKAREKALKGLMNLASTLTSPRADSAVDAAFSALARARSPEVLPIMRHLMDEFEVGRQLSPSAAVSGLANLDSEAGRKILENWARSGSVPVRRAAMRALYSKEAPEEPAGVGAPTEIPTLALILGHLISRAPHWPLHETDLNRLVSPLCADTATARRWMVGLGLADRERNLYALTETGELLATVESRLDAGGVRGAKRVELLQ
ncbi:MAG: hypothetical protein R6U92_08135 [Bacillota bacterium]